MKSRLVTLTMLVFGMLLSTTGAGLAVSGLLTTNAADAQYGPKPPQTTTTTQPPSTPQPPAPTNQVLPQPAVEQPGPVPEIPAVPESEVAPEVESETPATPAAQQPLQPSRQVAAATDEGSLPFTGLAAIPILVGGIALLGGGAVLRRQTRE